MNCVAADSNILEPNPKESNILPGPNQNDNNGPSCSTKRRHSSSTSVSSLYFTRENAKISLCIIRIKIIHIGVIHLY